MRILVRLFRAAKSYIYRDMRGKLLKKLAYVIMTAEESHDRLSIS